MSVNKIFEGQNINGSSQWEFSKGSAAMIFAWGDFGGGTVKIEISPDGSESFEESELTFTSKGMKKFYIPSSTRFRCSLSGATSPNINCTIIT